jgi:hypothetical protein
MRVRYRILYSPIIHHLRGEKQALRTERHSVPFCRSLTMYNKRLSLPHHIHRISDDVVKEEYNEEKACEL